MEESYLVFNRGELLVDILPVSSTELFETTGICIHYYIKVNQIKYKTRFLMKKQEPVALETEADFYVSYHLSTRMYFMNFIV